MAEKPAFGGIPFATKPDRAFHEMCSDGRGELRDFASRLQAYLIELQRLPAADFVIPGVSDLSEMIANLKLAYRHVEDATMRIGKAIQAFDGGKSVYPR